VLSEVARGAAGDVAYPMPWAATATTSFLSTPDDTRRELGSAGFEVEQVKDVLQRAVDFGARSRALVERGGKPPYRANALIHGDIAATTSRMSPASTRTAVSCRSRWWSGSANDVASARRGRVSGGLPATWVVVILHRGTPCYHDSQRRKN
jgi:hypothetical protein